MRRQLLASAAGLALLVGAPAFAQQATQPAGPQAQPATPAQPMQQVPAQQQAQPGQTLGQPAPQQVQPGQQQVAQQCLEQLQQLNARMHQDGFWLAGWGGRWGYGFAGEPAATGAVGTPAGGVGAPATGAATGAAGGPAAMTGAVGGPATGAPPGGGMATAAPTAGAPQTWGAVPWGAQPAFGWDSPRHQIQILFGAGNVLAHRGDQQGCQAVAQSLEQVYGDYLARLQEAGVTPAEIQTWRQEQIVAARPVAEFGGMISVDDVTGTEVRNAQDQRLGTIEDVILDPQSGQISHVIVSHGGFLGLGATDVAVPWQLFRTSPGLNTFVLNVPENVVEAAPRVDRGRWGSPTVYRLDRQQIDSYWQQHAPA